MKISREDVDWMTPAEYQCCLSEWSKHQEEKEKQAYGLSRFNAWLSNPNLKPNVKPEDLCRFPWEELQVAKVTHGSKTDAISETKFTA